jgi:ribosomal protein S18 acetylase RimI-like enzyme
MLCTPLRLRRKAGIQTMRRDDSADPCAPGGVGLADTGWRLACPSNGQGRESAKMVSGVVGADMEMEVQGPLLGMASACEPILRDLPQWFGIPEATEQYLKDIEGLPTFIASLEGEAVGFLTLREHSEYAAEIHVMGVRPELHRNGVGRALVCGAESSLRKRGFEYMQVKTLSERHPDLNYARTRAFYSAMGFRPLEEFPELWGEENPCLQMIKSLAAGRPAPDT